MRKITGILLLTLGLSTGIQAQDKLSYKEKFEVEEADAAFINAYYEDALGMYKAVYNKHMTNAYLNSRIGFCYLEMDQLEDALSYFGDVNEGSLKAKHADFYFGYGLALQKSGDYNGALEKYNSFKEKGKSKDIKYYELDRFLAQVNYALVAKETPVSAVVTNLGDSINSNYDDYHPSVTADGKTFIFTSRRSDSKGGELLDDGQYYEDIYEARWNEDFEAWGESKPVEGALNSNEYDANCSITPDGTSILVYRNISSENKKVISPTGGGDIYTSKKGRTGRWGSPKLIEGVNSTAMDVGACVTSDGKTMYFISDRQGMLEGKGAQGGRDIWVSKMEEDGTWGKAKNIGDVINTEYDEVSVFIHPNGKTLFFASEGHDEKNFGGFDIFRSTLGKDGKWGAPENIGYPINSEKDEKEFVVSTDGKVGWISSKKEKGKNNMDIYQVDLSHYNVLTGESEQLSILKGKVVDASTGLPLSTKIKIKESVTGEEEVISSNEAGEYFNTLVSNKTYEVSIQHKGYKSFSTTVAINAPKVKKKKKRRRTNNRRGKKVKAKKNTGTHTVVKELRVERLIPIDVVSKDLFKTQIVAFKKGDNGYEINSFSKGILDMFAAQQVRAKELELSIDGHYSEGEDANMESKKLADLVVDYLVSKGADKSKLRIRYLGDTAPIAGNETETGKNANRRVEVKILL